MRLETLITLQEWHRHITMELARTRARIKELEAKEEREKTEWQKKVDTHLNKNNGNNNK